MNDAIRLRELSYRAGRDFALRSLDLAVPAGSVYGFLGANGAGKTTTIRLMMGMLAADDGTIDVLGHRIPEAVVPALTRIGYVPERVHLYPMLTVEETMRHHAAFYPRWSSRDAARLQRAFCLRPDAPVGRLSKGEAGKLMMLLALAVRPELLVLDEPTDGLDPVVRRDVLAAIIDYVAETRATVFISSHLVHEQERICDWVGVLDAGRMVAELPMAEFRAGIKRLRVRAARADVSMLPFRLMSRRAVLGQEEEWIVRDWRPDMRAVFDATNGGVVLREVEDLDLEESFVELLRTSRDAGAVSPALVTPEAA